MHHLRGYRFTPIGQGKRRLPLQAPFHTFHSLFADALEHLAVQIDKLCRERIVKVAGALAWLGFTRRRR